MKFLQKRHCVTWFLALLGVCSSVFAIEPGSAEEHAKGKKWICTPEVELIVLRLKKTGATLIFATTTPYPAGVYPCRLPEDAVKYNEAALKVMKKHEVVVNDLYSVSLPHLKEWQMDKNVHFNPHGKQELAKRVADAIEKQL